jgi:hypothetical protein
MQSNKLIQYISRIKDKNHMIFPADEEKASHKSQHNKNSQLTRYKEIVLS